MRYSMMINGFSVTITEDHTGWWNLLVNGEYWGNFMSEENALRVIPSILETLKRAA